MRKVAHDVRVVQKAVSPPGALHERDPLLAALQGARARISAGDDELRLLLAYARRFVYPHPYSLGELAAAAGMSASGIRSAFGAEDVRRVAEATGLEPTPLERDKE
jgi:hypothetical protein